MKHQKTITKYNGTLEDLGKDIGDLDYDSLVELFDTLSKKFNKDAVHDLELNHPKVAKHLNNIAKAIKELLDSDISPLADICRKPNLENNTEEEK